MPVLCRLQGKANRAMAATSAAFPVSNSASDLITLARTSKHDFIIQEILSPGDIFLLHGFEETFKSVFVIDLAAHIADGKDYLALGWRIPKGRRVGIIETEMHPEQMGIRLSRMYPHGDAPADLRFMLKEVLRNFKRARSLEKKFAVVADWVRHERLEVVVLDTANDFFRGKDDPKDETKAGEFFDRLRELNVAWIIVRHDRKQQAGGLPFGDNGGNESIRGSAEFKEDPETIFQITRRDKRINEVKIECGKMRYGLKPEPAILWCDAGSFQMTAEKPVLAILGKDWMLRSRIVDEGKKRFGLSERKTDDMLAELKPVLEERQAGHSKQFRVRNAEYLQNNEAEIET